MSATRPDIAGRFVAVAGQLATPPFSRRAEETVAACLRLLGASAWPDIAWQSSRLTRDGCPVEFAFCGCDCALRMTIEPAPPEAPEPAKLDCALRLLETIGHTLPGPERIAQWRDGQAGHKLRWGTWLGLRQAGDDLRTKLYVEMPQAPSSQVQPGRLRMIGYEPVTRRTEFYCALPAMDADQLACILARHGIRDWVSPVEQLCALTGLPAATALKWLDFGLSTATDHDGRPLGVALFFRAMAARGGQARIRDALLMQQEARGIQTSAYRSLFANAVSLPDHGVVTLELSSDGGTSLRAGISGAALLTRWMQNGARLQAA